MKFQRYSKVRCEKCNIQIVPDFTVFGHSLRRFFIQKDYLAANLTEECSFSVQCKFEHGICLEGKCTCEERYFELNGKCEIEEKSHLIPIIVGSAIGGTIALTLITYCWLSRHKRS
ncbi:hypothetical protein TNIN_265741 [Trichonephila inaurata madagascariensis]|uniref:EB domain-containing protein n=1 Tax=Trichonephila inaurata madagascariensis TaxID=2747483 RepID=A0A8X6WNX5_9ARAC|nr:hypothetical protein TNIN_265741 [Trichonephila inaurata madagascariensis]